MNFDSSDHTGRWMYGNFGFYPDEIHATFLVNSGEAGKTENQRRFDWINGRPSTAPSTITFDSTRVEFFSYLSL